MTLKQLLHDSVYFSGASDDILDALCEKAVAKDLQPGDVLVYEDKLVENVIVIESGILLRTKGGESALENDANVTVTIDKLSGRGRISGLLHAMETEAVAFATVSAETNARVWLLPCEHVRTVLSDHSALFLLQALAKEVRIGTKSLRGLLNKFSKTEEGQEGEGEKKRVVKILCYDTTSWVSEGFTKAIQDFNKEEEKNHSNTRLHMDYTADRLTEQSSTYAAGYVAVCIFVNDTASSKVIQTLSLLGVRMIALRCAGFDGVDTDAAAAYGLTVARVPAYSPYAVAEMAVSLLLSLNRKLCRANARVKMANFSLDSSLMGVDIHGKTVGVMGTGKIGQILCNIMLGFGARLLCYDKNESKDVIAAGGTYVPKETLFAEADIIFVMLPLLAATHHLVNEESISQMKEGVLLVNTSRGGLVDTQALLEGIRSGKIGGVGLDVYENEKQYFFQDWGSRHIPDPTLLALIGEPNVILTAHQAFFTKEAIGSIVSTTLNNIVAFHEGKTGLSHPNNCLPAPK